MPLKMVKVRVLQEGVRYNDVPHSPGESLEIEESLVPDWIRLGYARVDSGSSQEAHASAKEKPKTERTQENSKGAKAERPGGVLDELLAKTDAELAEIAKGFDITEGFANREDLAKAIMVKAGYKV